MQNGFGAVTKINYRPLTDSSVYLKEATAVYPTQEVQDPTMVVSSHDEENGIGGRDATYYTYGGLKTDLRGHGNYGFHWRQTVDGQSQIRSRITYLQEFPFIGTPQRVETFQPVAPAGNGGLLKSTVSTWTYRILGTGQAKRHSTSVC